MAYQKSNPNPGPGEITVNIYGYVPSLSLNLTACVVFGLLLVVHLFYAVKWKQTRAFQILLVVGCSWEIVGYAFRIVAHRNVYLLIAFVIPYFFIVCECVRVLTIHLMLMTCMNSQVPRYFSALRKCYLQFKKPLQLEMKPI